MSSLEREVDGDGRFEDATVEASIPPEPLRPARLVVFKGDQTATYSVPLSGKLIIGRSREVDVCIDDPMISRRHAEIWVDGDRGLMTVRDLGSANGTQLRGERLTPQRIYPLEPGVLLQLGEISVVVQLGLKEEAPAST